MSTRQTADLIESLRHPFDLVIAKAAVVPCVPTVSNPISSKHERQNPNSFGVGAKLKSTSNFHLGALEAIYRIQMIDKGVILVAVLNRFCHHIKAHHGTFSSARLTTPGPETPTSDDYIRFTDVKAPAMKRLFNSILAKNN